MNKENVLTCFKLAIAELQAANEDCSKAELEAILDETENLLQEARESLGK